MTEHGAILIDGIQRGTTQKCPHCGGHFLIAAAGDLQTAQRTMGEVARPRVHCRKCGRLTCGRNGCDPAIACVPLEARLEHTEGRATTYDDAIQSLEDRGVVIL